MAKEKQGMAFLQGVECGTMAGFRRECDEKEEKVGALVMTAHQLLLRVPSRLGRAALGDVGTGEHEGAALAVAVRAMVKHSGEAVQFGIGLLPGSPVVTRRAVQGCGSRPSYRKAGRRGR